MPEILLAAIAAPAFALPLAQVCRWIAPKLIALHRALTWPWRIALGVMGLKFMAEVLVAVEVLARDAR